MQELVQEEIEKLKELYESSSKAFEKWPQSDLISSCGDDEFPTLLQNLSEVDLEAAVFGLQRQLEIEGQLVKCLEQLRDINSDKSDLTSKLIKSQERVARLRSRLLRCVNKQLVNHGNNTVLPPWHGPVLTDKNNATLVSPSTNTTMEHDRNHVVKASPNNDDQLANGDSLDSEETKNDHKRTGSDLSQVSDPGSLNWIEPKTINDLPPMNTKERNNQDNLMEEEKLARNESAKQQQEDGGHEETGEKEAMSLKPCDDLKIKVHKGRDSLVGDEGLKKLQQTLEKNLHDKSHDTKVPEAASSSKTPPPPKPVPYSALETMPMLDKVKSNSDVLEAVGDDDSDGILMKEQALMQDWDPTKLLEDLFGKDKEGPQPQSPTDSSSAAMSIVTMSGYMDKLPSSYKQKKSSVFKSWKRRHFKAFDGKLFYFEDHRNNEPLGMVDLKGSTVVISSGKILEINDSEGKPALKLRCASQAEAEDWKQAIENEAKHEQEPVYEEVDQAKGSVIVIDLGSSTVRAGFAKEEAWPEVMFPCVCSVLKGDDSDCVYGYAALEPKRRKISILRFPLRRSLKIDKLKFSPVDLTGILEHAFHLLKVDPSKHKVVMTVPQNTSQDDKGALVEILLGFFNVEACYLQEQAILAMYSYSAVSGVIVDVGDHIDVIPVVEGCVIESGASRLPYGGRQVTDMLARLLTEKGHRFFSEVESYITRYIKEQCCYVSEKEICNEQETPCYSTDIMLDKYKIPDGTRKVTVDTARYRCTEGLFDPIVWGKDHDGISDLVYKAIMACSMDVRKQMARSIYLSGGGSMLPGFPERLQTEVCAKLPPHTIVQVHAGTDRHHAAFIGASVVARLPLFEELCITQEEWEESGIDAMEKWHNV